MTRPSDHWIARNFAINHPATRCNMRNLFIPNWQKEIEEWREVIAELSKPNSDEFNDLVARAEQKIVELNSNIIAATERLNQT